MTRGRRSRIAALPWVLCLAIAVPAHAQERDAARVDAGESIYLRGVLGSGQALRATRDDGGTGATGAAAACVNCHQHSGLGATHQSSGIGASAPSNQIPPIAGRYLFEPVRSGPSARNLPYVDGMRSNRSPYTEATLARAIREGIDADGRRLRYLMPRFEIGDGDMASLIAYLRTLDPTRAPGVTDTVLHFATVIAPDVDPARRRAMLDVLNAFFAERNARQLKPSTALQASGRTQYSRTMFMVNRQWQLHVWDLHGEPSRWGAQLAEHYAREPVLAVVSGLGGAAWRPVHEFCQRQHLACLFPNVEVPVDAPGDFYSLYFSRGVLLEADLLAERIAHGPAGSAIRSVRQLYRSGDSGEAGARALSVRLAALGLEVQSTVLPAQGGNVADALAGAARADAIVLWLRAPDLASLGDARGGPSIVFASGLLGGLEAAPIPASWRPRTHLAYPVDLPQQRVVRVDYPMGWFRARGIPIVDEQLQSDTQLACGLLSEALKELAGTFYGPYLVEELQTMVEHRLMTGYYPRLTLAENQHFASRGGYIVRFAEPTGTKLLAEGEWVVPSR